MDELFFHKTAKPFPRRDLPEVIVEAEPDFAEFHHLTWHRQDGGRVLILANYTPEKQSWKFENESGVIPPRSYQRIDLP